MASLNLKNQIDPPLEPFELFQNSSRVIAHNPLGLFTTINEARVPRSRWMVGVMSGPGLSKIYSLTGRHSRKLTDIGHNATVSWVFTSPHQEDVVTVTGRGRVLPSLHLMDIDWSILIEATPRYAMNALTDTEETAFAVLETVVESVELISPRLGIFTPRDVPFYQPMAAQ